MKLFLICILLCGAALAADDEGAARLLASKNILNQYLVEGRDLTVEYKIFNIGGSAALNVQLQDDSFPEGDFTVVNGNLQVNWEKIAPNSNVSHSVVIQSLKYGYFNFTAAEVSYSTSEDSDERQVGYTSAPGEGGIVNSKEFDRKFSPHFLDWLVFAVMTLPSLGIPFLLWYSSQAKYQLVKNKKA